MNRHLLLPAFLVLAAPGAHAQWNVPTNVEFTGSAPGDRQVLGLSAPGGPTSGVPALADRALLTTMGTATGVDQLTLDLQPAIAAYTPGLQVTFVPQNANDTAVTLNVNGLGAVAVVKGWGTALDSADLQPGMPVTAVFDGAAFQIVTQLYRGCPQGFIPASRDYCIETTPGDTISYYAANVACVEKNARLCSFAEWYQGCAMTGGILSSILSYEWVDSAANDTNKAKRVGQNSTLSIGCDLGGPATPLTRSRYRCCYDR